MRTYEHTQKATEIVVATAAMALAFLIGAVMLRPLILAAMVLIFIAWLFHSLTIEITDDELVWWFGPGWIRRRAALGDIVSAQVVRTNALEGWGIHYSRFGWLYNVSGRGAVAIVLRNGKRFCLGTDEPEALAAQLTTHR